jgi:hypothetical protein
MVQQGVEQGSAPVAAARMHNQPGRLVEHDQRLVLVTILSAMSSGSAEDCLFIGRFGNVRWFAAPELVLRFADRLTRHGTRPSRIQFCRRLRECCGHSRAST